MGSPVLFLALFLFQIERKGLKLLDPPIRLVDVSNREVVWDKEHDSMEVSIQFSTRARGCAMLSMWGMPFMISLV
jgi:hypothetical protein